MKAADFAYVRAASVDDAVALLATHGDRAKLLSGGQSLLPAMNLRLISPELIIDIGGIAALQGIAVTSNTLRIGALTRHVDVQRSPEIAACAPLLVEAITHVAHPAIRNRGTIGGSLAYADPASELPACMLALDATLVVRSKSGERRIAAVDFFQGIFQTALSADELLTAIELPISERNSAFFFHEFARRHGDYAIVGLAAQAVIEGGTFARLRLAYFSVGDRPILADSANKLVARMVTPALLSEASEALGDELAPQDDQQASGPMRRHLAKVLLTRCVAALLSQPELVRVTE
jgi:aerobic carbon-monoxide dehydrogenase medium subunit